MTSRIEAYFDGKMDRAGRIAFLREMESNEALRNAFSGRRNLSGLLSLAGYPSDKWEGHADYQRFMLLYQKKSRRAMIRKVFRYAAMICLLIGAGWTVSYHFYQYQDEKRITYNTLSVPAGQRASVTLCDGTEVWLNARSTLTYPSSFPKSERKVQLTGEAFFNVTKDGKPFFVTSGRLNVEVLGTTFNMCDYAETDSAGISLLAGSVKVFGGYSDRIYEMHPEEYLYYKGGTVTTGKGINEDDFLWIQGVYVFNKANLLDIVKKLELYYDTRIIVKNPDLAQHVYTGKFRQRDSVTGILQIIQEAHPFKLSRDEANNTIILE